MVPRTSIIVKSYLFNAGGKLLLIKRDPDDDRRPGEWDVPGGSVDEGEDFTQAIIRETTEEVGIALPQSSLSLRYTHTGIRDERDIGGDLYNVVRLCFVVMQAEYSTIILSHEHVEYQWATIEEALELLSANKWGEALRYIVENKLVPALPIL